ncbi:MAG TPA: FHA domain-containing protein [Ktedonobacterales bacterium]|jgi:pSer/pThr/pTyr-binding forkhead associated (FHA) protein|nr:FHA domain-containing protein [Ktedonobacterales bacterium]
MDFPTWVALGSYGGLASALLAAGSVSLLALRLRRGSRQQIARASLVSLIACALMLAPIWWLLRRFDVYGPTLGAQEVAFWLVWISLFGWVIPLLTTAFFFALASPEQAQAAPQARVSGAPIGATPLDDPARQTYPYGPDRPWGRLTPVDDDAAPAIDLSLEVALIGRDPEDDIILDDDLVSRRHAEARWRAGQAYLLDRGSLNGTRRNAQKVRGLVALEDGDILQFGVRCYRFALLAPTGADALEETRKVAASSASHPLNAPLALVGETGALAGRRWELIEKTTRIGRDPAAAIIVQDSSVSRFHAQITRQASGYYLADLESSNGTQVNGEPVSEPHRIVAGDVLRFGEVVFRCEGVPIISQPASTLPPELTAPASDATTV